MNEHIINIIDDQFKSYHLGTLLSDHMDLDEESILLSLENNNINIRCSKMLNDGHKYRLSLLMPYIQNAIYNLKIKKLQIIICLGDILKQEYFGIPVLCFSKRKHLNALLIPNIDFFTGAIYSFFKESSMDINYFDKQDSSIFVGSSTGPFEYNARILYGKKCLDSGKKHICIINNLCQSTQEEWIMKYPWVMNLVGQPQNINTQLKNKIVVNIDGNTVCWSRLYWQINSNSIPVYINKNNNDIQFLDYIDNTKAYVSCTLDDSIDVLNSILDNYSSQTIKDIKESGKEFCNKYFSDYIANPQLFLQSVIDRILDQAHSLYQENLS